MSVILMNSSNFLQTLPTQTNDADQDTDTDLDESQDS